jgi:hypothetical protein
VRREKLSSVVGRGRDQGSLKEARQAGRNRQSRFPEASQGLTIRQTASELFNRFGSIKFCLMRFYGDAPLVPTT